MDFSFEWKVNFAIVISVASLLISLIRWRIDKHETRKYEKIRAYEEIFDDANYILTYPLLHRNRMKEELKYQNANCEIQTAVRQYLKAHWMDKWLSGSKYIPEHITDAQERVSFLEIVVNEARQFESKLEMELGSFSLPDLSPVFYLDEPEIRERLSRVMTEVGRRYSFFSDQIQRFWDNTRVAVPESIRNEYCKAKEVCSDYFTHNDRDFDDPYHDLVQAICYEYRSLTRSKAERFLGLTWRLKTKVRHSLRKPNRGSDA